VCCKLIKSNNKQTLKQTPSGSFFCAKNSAKGAPMPVSKEHVWGMPEETKITVPESGVYTGLQSEIARGTLPEEEGMDPEVVAALLLLSTPAAPSNIENDPNDSNKSY
jgi:hypothetical protein